MKHLIIGAGRMGLRHMRILQKMGQIVELVDSEFDPKTYQWVKWRPDSVLICTWPDSHIKLINEIPKDIPIFCEKPLIVGPRQKIAPRKAVSLMACNWTFCQCIKGKKELHLFYPSKCKYRYLDYIHFILIPRLKVSINFTRQTIATFSDYKAIHINGPCDMFEKQMKHWLNVIQGKEKSRLSFNKAIKLNRKLLK